jgi:hypothetical protein
LEAGMRRLRAFIVISGTTLCVLIAAAFVVSGWLSVGVRTSGGITMAVSAGGFRYANGPPHVSEFIFERHGTGLSSWNAWQWDALDGRAGARSISLPLVAVLAVVAIPTLLIWRCVPRHPAGHCQNCGYDLSENESGYCPKCGRPGGRVVFPSEGVVTRIQRLSDERRPSPPREEKGSG